MRPTTVSACRALRRGRASLPRARLAALLLPVALAAAPACGDDAATVLARSSSTTTAPPGTTATTTTTIAATTTTTTARPPTTTAPACSAAVGSGALPDEPALGAAADRTRRAIAAAAVRCDWDTLAALTAREGDFTFRFDDGSTDAVGYWKELERRGARPLLAMVVMLRAPYATIDTPRGATYAWPSAYDTSPLTDAVLAPLRGFYGEGELAAFRAAGTYLGWRLGIRADGTWAYFVEGD